MMNYFFIEPEVAGGLGSRTRVNTNVHPPIVYSLHYELEGWLGDVLLESFPVFIITQGAAQLLVQAGLTGFELDVAEITKSEQFEELHPQTTLPFFAWFKPIGAAGIDDFGCAADGRLIASERALKMLETAGIHHASVEPFQKR